MPVGTITIDDTGAASGTGAARELYELIAEVQQAYKPLTDPEEPDADFDGSKAEWKAAMLPFVVRVKRAWAREAIAHARAMAGGISGNRPPAIADLTALNLGALVATEGDFGLHLAQASEGALTNVRGYEQAASGAYSFTAGVSPLTALAGSPYVGLHLRAASGRLTTLSLLYVPASNGLVINVGDWTNVTTFSASAFSSTGIGFPPRLFLRIKDTGTAHEFAWGTDGENFSTVLSRSRTAWLADGGIARGAHVRALNGAAALTVFSWDVE